MVEKRVGHSAKKGRAQKERDCQDGKEKGPSLYKKGRAQREVRGKRQTRRRQKNRKMQSSIKQEAEVDVGDKRIRGTATPSAGRRTSKATL